MEGESATRFEDGENADQPLGNSVTLAQLSSFFLLSDIRPQILKGPVMLLGHRDSVAFYTLGVFQQERLEIASIQIETV